MDIDITAALDELNTRVFSSADEVFALTAELNEAGLTWAFDEDSQSIQVIDIAS